MSGKNRLNDIEVFVKANEDGETAQKADDYERFEPG